MKTFAAFLLAAAVCPVHAIERGGLPGDGAYAMGGVGLDEIEQLSAERAGHSLWLITAAKGSGAYVSDATVRIADAKGRLVFDRALAGPWLLVDLLPGAYSIDVSYEGATQHRALVVKRQAPVRQFVFYFDVPGEELPASASGRAD